MTDKKVTAFFPLLDEQVAAENVNILSKIKSIDKVNLFTLSKGKKNTGNCVIIRVSSFCSSEFIRYSIKKTEGKFLLLAFTGAKITIDETNLDKIIKLAESSGAGITYSDYYDVKHGDTYAHPLIDYQLGSVRDDFDFGHIILIRKTAAEKFLTQNDNYNFAGLYSLRLSISEDYPVIRFPEYLYSAEIIDKKKSGVKQFEYVDPKNRDAQIEMEHAVTGHLKRRGAFLKPPDNNIDYTDNDFKYEASVIIPVKNRAKTIMNAVVSALQQRTDFAFNIIVVDNHSTDETTELLKILADKESRLLHIIPKRNDLGIGGCWNEAVSNPDCGRFAVQLDSDDIYKNKHTLQKIIDKFHEENSAMVIGSYELTDFKLNPIPPGLIDHKEWTNENGHNNALRINGFGAPRAFFTPVIRKIRFPNVSYGEDYSVTLAISRKYKIGRIYESLYLCRRWDGNTDTRLSIEKENLNNIYKDGLRTNEIIERQKINDKSSFQL